MAWRPAPEEAERTFLRRFLRRHGLGELEALLRRAAEEPEWFWAAVERELGVVWRRPYERVLDLSRGPAWPEWFVGGRLNVADSCLDRWAEASPERTAILWEGDDGATRSLTFARLREECDRLARGLGRLGIGRGDRVGVYLPMLPETAVTLLALAKLGAVFVPAFSGFAGPAVAARLRDAGARLLLTADGFLRRGRPVDMKREADAAVAEAPSVERVVVVRRLGGEVPWQPGRDLAWEEVLALGGEGGRPLRGEELEASALLMILYTSGTTGRPKGVLHVHAGFPLKAAADLALAFDLQPGERLGWVTDMGWMMGPWEVYGGLMRGAAVFLYEGVPDHPAPDRLWRLVERHRLTHLGLSPTAVRALMAAGDGWARGHDLSSLRAFGSTGEPWNPEPWRWLFEVVGGGRLPILNYSGGTEISGGILGCFLAEPVKPCAFRGPLPGVVADVVDEQGRPLRGEPGELVLRAPWVGQARGFWGDPERYLETYWSRWPGLWAHGDLAVIEADGSWSIQGRSDDTLKVGGKRVGPAEIESALVDHPAVAEAVAVGVPHPVKGEVPACYVVLRAGYRAGPELAEELKEWVASRLGRPLRPEEVRFTREIPRTRNGKLLRRLVRRLRLGQELGDTSALENPAAVEAIRQAE
ncbi:MAG: AMP-binding protein [Firmicutes bacterium]|nr:AMP-binding protein [Bacillota bacterium]